MTDYPNQPREYDAVLGGIAPPPLQGAILGGIEGVKHRLSSPIIEARVAALNEALNYGKEGLNLVIQALNDKLRKVRHAAAIILQEREEPQAKLELQKYKSWSKFERLSGLPYGYATTFANRKVIEFDPKIHIIAPRKTAYALRTIKISSQGRYVPDMMIADKLKILLQARRACEIEALVFGMCGYEPESVVNALVSAHKQLNNLKAVFIGDIEDSECMISSINQSNLSPILEAYPKLEVLKVRGGSDHIYWGGGGDEGLAFDPLRHDKLKALIIESGGLHHQVINQICELELPALEYLELWLGRDNYGGTSSIDDLMPIISGQQFPKLKYLGLRNSEYSDDIAFAIVQSPLIEQLIELDFSMGTLGDEGAEALLNCLAVHQLDTLNVDDNCLSDEMVDQMKQLDIEVIANSRQKMSGYLITRYCTVAE